MSRDTTELLVHFAPDALITVNAAGEITYANAAVVLLFGYPPAELVGQSIEILIPERLRETHRRHRGSFVSRPSVREMGSRIVNLTARRRDGTEFPAEIRLAPIESPEGSIVVAAVRDVTDRRRMADELLAAREDAERANRAKGGFLATASHDLRQPLQTLQLLHAALARQMTDQRSADLLERQQRALCSMADLLNALLDISKLESGTVKPEIEDVAVVEVFADLRRQFESTAAAQGLALSIESCDTLVRTDRVLLRQMIQNLLGNAIKYTKVGGVTVRCTRTPREACIEVTDTGMGIADDQLSRIFDAYYQVKHSSTNHQGLGLGLSIVKHIAELLDCRVEVESRAGRGTSFRLFLPIGEGIIGHAPGLRPDEPPRSEERAIKPGVLVIEDDDAVRAALELVLQLEGYPTWTASGGEAAEDVFSRHGRYVDLVVSDFHLEGGKNGLEVLQQLRGRAGRELPAVFLSGDTSSILRSLGDVPQARLLRKPVDGRQLVQTLEELFGGMPLPD